MPPRARAKAITFQRLVATHASKGDLMDRVLDWFSHGSPRGRIAFEDQAPVVKAIWTLHALSTSLVVSGTTHFLLDMGSEARRAYEYAHMVGAPITAQFGTAMMRELKRLRRGKLPAETAGAMTEAIKALEARDEAAGGAGLFLELDDEYSAAVIEELASVLPRYVIAHADDIAAAFDAYQPPPEPVIESTATSEAGARYFSADYRDYDARAREWLRRAGTLSPADYAEIAKRYRKGVGDDVRRKTMRVWTDGPRVGRTNEEWKPEFKATLQLSADVERSLTAMLSASDMDAATQRKALVAYGTAASVVKHLPELERLPWGQDVIARGLGPFDGFIPPWNAAW